MDRYKFGNNICRLREERELTQEQFAKMLDVTDKAVSKWENGQSIPRIETLEKMSLVLATPIEALLAAGKDNKTIISIKNDNEYMIHIDIDGKHISVPSGEREWVNVNPEEIKINIKSEWNVEEFADIIDEINEEETEFKEKIKGKILGYFAKKSAEVVKDTVLFADCTYKCTGFRDGDTITVCDDVLDLENKVSMWMTDALLMSYPKLSVKNGTATLIRAVGNNSAELIKQQKRLGLFEDVSISFITALLFYPIRVLYFKHICKPKTIMKNIRNADNLRLADVESPKKKKGCGCIASIMAFVLLVFASLVVDFVFEIIFIENEHPALIASDHSQITYHDDVYVRIEELPEIAYPETFLSASVWEDARTDGTPRIDQALEDSKVMLYKDKHDNKYLWLVENYTDVIFTEDGEDKEYDDFTEHYVYMLEKQ